MGLLLSFQIHTILRNMHAKISRVEIQIVERMFKELKFITGSALKILYALALDPMRAFYPREIAKETEVSVGSANRTLRVPTERELATKEKRGKIFLYRFNTESRSSDRSNHVTCKLLLTGYRL